MRHLIAAVLAVLVLVAPARADEGIEKVISAQIEAFLADDFETAFTFASPTIKGIFGTPERFGMMVRQGYPMVWRPSEVRFLALDQREGALWQAVMVRDAAGALHVLDYQMVPGEDGWQINAVTLRDTAGNV